MSEFYEKDFLHFWALECFRLNRVYSVRQANVKYLNKDKARDALGLINELFKEEVAGTDLKLATLKFMNHMKKNHVYPEALNPCNITSIYKQKGSHKDFDNYRGVFRVTVLRSILDRLIYNDNYHTIDDTLTDGNVGAQKQ